MFDWNDLRYFLEVARRQTYVAAAERLGVDHTTVARRIKALESELDQRLFERASSGFALTPAGRTLLRHAEAVESHSLNAAEEIGGLDAAPRGVVRIATTEALGAAFLAQHVGALRARHPDIELEIVASPSPPSLTARDIDLALTLARPRARKWSAEKLTDYNLYLYGSRGYLAERAPIRSPADLKAHAFVGYIDDLLLYDELKVLDEITPAARTVFRSNSIVAQHNAVNSGLGLALLHPFAVRPEDDLMAVLPETICVRRAYWIAVHDDLRRSARVEAVAAFLKDLAEAHAPQFLTPAAAAYDTALR